MKKLYLFTILTILFTSCTDEDLIKRSGTSDGLSFSVEVPGLMTTRALGKNPTKEALNETRLFVFGEDKHYIGNYKATMENIDEATGVANFSVPTLRRTEQKRIVHFIAGELDEFDLSAADTEQTALDKLTVSNDKEAYWQRHEFPNFNPEDGSSIKLKDPITLIRNFCAINLTPNSYKSIFTFNADNNEVSVKIIGSALVNTLKKGQIAPYNPKQPDKNGGFIDYIEFLGLENKDRPYKAFYEYTGQYDGFIVNDNEIETIPPTDSDYTTETKYAYARNIDASQKQTFLLLKTQTNKSDGLVYRYYKIDIAAKDPDNQIVSVMNLYNNFTYTINITDINGEGYDTAEKAMEAAASNNISSSINVSETPNISDGLGNSLSVGSLTLMMTEDKEYTIPFEYKEQDIPTTQGVQVALYPSDQKILTAEIDAANSQIIFKPTSLPGDLQTQYVIITTPKGLSRRMTVNVRKPFEFLATRCQKYVEQTTGAGVSCILALPPNLPISLFPLEIDVQPEDKVIYPDPSKNKLPVGTTDWKEFHYKVSVSYNEYRLNNFVNCFFKTNQAESATNIKVMCEHFTSSTMQFENGTPYTFINPTITDATNIPYEKGSSVVLSFEISNIPSQKEQINIFSNYLENPQVTSGTGEITIGRATQFIFEPTSTGKHTITFQTKYDVVGESLELTSSDMSFIPELIPYRNKGAEVVCKVNGTTLQDGTVISIYNDAYHTEKVSDLIIGGENGENPGYMHMKSFAGYTRDKDRLYFQYTDNNVTPVKFYYAEASADELISSAEANQKYTLIFQ